MIWLHVLSIVLSLYDSAAALPGRLLRQSSAADCSKFVRCCTSSRVGQTRHTSSAIRKRPKAARKMRSGSGRFFDSVGPDLYILVSASSMKEMSSAYAGGSSSSSSHSFGGGAIGAQQVTFSTLISAYNPS